MNSYRAGVTLGALLYALKEIDDRTSNQAVVTMGMGVATQLNSPDFIHSHSVARDSLSDSPSSIIVRPTLGALTTSGSSAITEKSQRMREETHKQVEKLIKVVSDSEDAKRTTESEIKVVVPNLIYFEEYRPFMETFNRKSEEDRNAILDAAIAVITNDRALDLVAQQLDQLKGNRAANIMDTPTASSAAVDELSEELDLESTSVDNSTAVSAAIVTSTDTSSPSSVPETSHVAHRHTTSPRPMVAAANSWRSALQWLAPQRLQQQLPSVTARTIAVSAVLEQSKWSALQSKYTCAICFDVLAAPTILPCSHSFCGGCLVEYTESCVCPGNAVEVIKNCPECRSEFREITYEKVLDEVISEQVESIERDQLSAAETEYRKSWKARREKFVERNNAYRRQRSNARIQQQADEEAEMVYYDRVVLVLTIAVAVVSVLAMVRLRK